MFKKSLLLMLAVFLIVSLTGCRKGPTIDADGQVEKIELYQSEGFTENSTVLLKTFTDKEQIDSIILAIRTSKKLEATLDVLAPDYSLMLYYEDGQTRTFYLWIGQLGTDYNGMIMDTEDTHTGYTLSAESVQVFLKLMP